MFDTDYTNEIVCPYCGYEYGDSWEHNDDDSTYLCCPECSEEFYLQVDIDITYCTYKKNCSDKTSES